MRYLNGWRDLEHFGIDALTGEACGLMMRVLCDVTDKGKRTIEKCFGVRSIDLQEQWNSGAKDDPHVGSIMLAPEMFMPIAVFCLLEAGFASAYVLEGGCVVGIEQTDAQAEIDRWRLIQQERIRRRFTYGGTAGDRNAHMMSGRVV